MKKITALIITAIMILSLTACGEDKEITTDNSVQASDTASSIPKLSDAVSITYSGKDFPDIDKDEYAEGLSLEIEQTGERSGTFRLTDANMLSAYPAYNEKVGNMLQYKWLLDIDEIHFALDCYSRQNDEGKSITPAEMDHGAYYYDRDTNSSITVTDLKVTVEGQTISFAFTLPGEIPFSWDEVYTCDLQFINCCLDDYRAIKEVSVKEKVETTTETKVPDFVTITIKEVDYDVSYYLSLNRLELTGEDIKPIAEVSNRLNYLYMDYNQIDDISALKDCINLEVLRLDGNQVTDISPLEKLTKLTELQLNDNKISDITVLKNLTSLTELELRDNKISDISALAGLTNASRINLSGNNIDDFTPLYELQNLEWLYVVDTGISDGQLLSLRQALPNCTVVSLPPDAIGM